MGNHYHLLAHFHKPNRSAFLRAFDSIIARLVTRYVQSFQDKEKYGTVDNFVAITITVA